eukprot:TRINITY_DN16163_c0_g1_i1.p1 TRINITY_DN16163_c0_g1~~TRINITY_DN16163_c0_g1_i1.p1  ORF type:complete len:162 (+),score=22.98 TRINITY_DN16163_c0_g1_i1:153-638(+)
MKVFASARIAEGQEVTMSYTDVRLPLADRQAALSTRGFGGGTFTCRCPRCRAADPRSEERSCRMQQLLVCDAASPREGLENLEELLKLYDEEGLLSKEMRADACFQAANYSLALGDVASAGQWSLRAYNYSCTCRGKGHPSSAMLRVYSEDLAMASRSEPG